MSWDKKRGQTRYLYRSVRVGAKTKKQYIGRGPAAEMVARIDALARRQRQERHAAWRAERDRLMAADLELEQLRVTLNLLVGATLLLAGYHRHHGEWRLRHDHRKPIEIGATGRFRATGTDG